MQVESFGTRVKKTTKKFFKTLGIILLIVAVIVFCFLYWATYEEGVMAGKVLRVSEKGMIFKTFEGKINLETFGALRGASPIAESFDFSIYKSDKDRYSGTGDGLVEWRARQPIFCQTLHNVPLAGRYQIFCYPRGTPGPCSQIVQT